MAVQTVQKPRMKIGNACNSIKNFLLGKVETDHILRRSEARKSNVGWG